MPVNLAPDLDAAQDVWALRQVLTTEINATSCPHQYNFHLHTTSSDGVLSPEQLIQQAVSLGLRGLAITDHHSVQGFQRAQTWLQAHHATLSPAQRTSLPTVWTGIEISAGLLGNEVHILCYAFDPAHPNWLPYVQGHTPLGDAYEAGRVIETAHAAGGIAVLAHPARYRRSPAELIVAATDLGIDGVETYYAYNNPNPWKPSPKQTQDVKYLGDRYGLLHTCGTDTHGNNVLKRL